jgi:hypothetical protein
MSKAYSERAKICTKMNDWISDLFEDQHAKHRKYLVSLVEDRVSWPDRQLKAQYLQRITEASDAQDLFRIGSELAEMLGPPNDPRKQIEERLKTML